MRSAPVEIRLRAPAKVNLRLAILAREESGYHQIETVFCTLRFSDFLIVRAPADHQREGIELHVRGPDVGTPEANLVHRAAVSFFRESGFEPSAEIRLIKRVPAGAGLGGGSSDAAATLLALNRLHRGTIADETLLRIGAELGSDVPFFLTGASRALAWGRGERLLPLSPLPRAPVILACPPFASPTPAAYALLAEERSRSQEERPPPSLPYVVGTDWQQVAQAAHNDFEDVLFPRHTELRALRDAMRAAGAVLSLLAGSGSAVFGVFADPLSRRSAAAALRRNFPATRIVQTWTGG